MFCIIVRVDTYFKFEENVFFKWSNRSCIGRVSLMFDSSLYTFILFLPFPLKDCYNFHKRQLCFSILSGKTKYFNFLIL